MRDEAIQQLTAGVAAGEPGAVERFYRGYFDFLLAEAYAATGRDESFVLDVVQESVLRALRSMRAVEREGTLRAWLRLVVQTTALDMLRAERRRAAREKRTGVAETLPPDGSAEQGDQLAWLRSQVAALDPRLAEMIELRYAHGWTLRRLAERFGGKAGAIDGQLQRALARLRKLADTHETRLVQPAVTPRR